MSEHDPITDDASARGDAEGAEGAEEQSEGMPSAISAAPRDELSAAPRGELDAIVEALIFASPEPLTLKAMCKLLSSEPAEDVEAAVARVAQAYERPGGLQLVQVAGGYQIVTRPELHEWVRRLFHERTTQKLSVQALETLAVIAYKQPVTAAEITEIRGVNTSGVLNTLMERQLIKISGRKQVVGRPFLYSTTREFLDRFGLKDLTDLPRIEDMAAVLGFEPPAALTESPAEPVDASLAPADEPAEDAEPAEPVEDVPSDEDDDFEDEDDDDFDDEPDNA